MKRYVLIALALGGACGGYTPTAPTDIRTNLSVPGSPSVVFTEPSFRVESSIEPAATPATRTFTVTGVLTDKAYVAWKISAATVTATPGSTNTKSSSAGQYALRLPAGTYTIKIVKSGYTTATLRKTVSGNLALNAPLTPIKPGGATARCKDRTWSSSQNRSGTCSHHGGVAYWVCPGKLCR